jgi:L-amino acid N-acyltransferase YncA
MRNFGFEEWGSLPDVVEMDGASYTVSILGLRLSEPTDS